MDDNFLIERKKSRRAKASSAGLFVCCDSHITCNCCTFAAASLQTNCSAAANRYAVTLQKVCSRFAVAVQYDSKLCMAMLQRAEKD